jgi:hypothetical protein
MVAVARPGAGLNGALAALVPAPSQELGGLGFQDGLEQQPGDLLQGVGQVPRSLPNRSLISPRIRSVGDTLVVTGIGPSLDGSQPPRKPTPVDIYTMPGTPPPSDRESYMRS